MRILFFVFIFLRFSLHAQESASIKGTVIDSTTKEAIPFCTVTILNAKLISVANAQSDINGNFYLPSIATGKYFVIAKYTGFDTDTTILFLKPGKIVNLTIQLKLNNSQNPETAYPVDYQVPLMDIDIANVGEYPWEKNPNPPESQEPLIDPDNKPGGTVTRETFLNIPTADTNFYFLQGTIRDNATGEPLPFVIIYALNTTNAVVTDMDGSYKLKLHAPGKYLIVAKYLGYQTFIVPIIVKKSGETKKLDISLCENIVELREIAVQNNSTPSAEDSIEYSSENIQPKNSDTTKPKAVGPLEIQTLQISNVHGKVSKTDTFNEHTSDFISKGEMYRFNDSIFYFNYRCYGAVVYTKRGNKLVLYGYGYEAPLEFSFERKENAWIISHNGLKAKVSYQ